MDKNRYILGIDVGGTGIKGAVVDTQTGELVAKRQRLLTPQPATPENMAATFAKLVEMHDWKGQVSCGFPSIVKDGVCLSASNIDETWIGTSIAETFSAACGNPVMAVNDADAAGVAIMRVGLGKGKKGVVLIITIGTGIGSALFLDGKLVPNTEFGHLKFKGDIAEKYCSNVVREKEELSWEAWGKRLNKYLMHLHRLFSLDCIILGGGVSKKFDKYKKYLTVDVEVLPAELKNAAGTIGAAFYAVKEKK